MRLIPTPESRLELARAARLMARALDILDEVRAPGEIGSMLDLAMVRLERCLDHDDRATAGVKTLMAQLEREFAAAPAGGDDVPSPWQLPRA